MYVCPSSLCTKFEACHLLIVWEGCSCFYSKERVCNFKQIFLKFSSSPPMFSMFWSFYQNLSWCLLAFLTEPVLMNPL